MAGTAYWRGTAKVIHFVSLAFYIYIYIYILSPGIELDVHGRAGSGGMIAQEGKRNGQLD